ncbi:MAG TPA: TerC/Alx family metal homeostasis membrane protein [Solirubrobacteraceae bacterium]|jgi:tellurite resistance protein TerC
MDVLPWVALVAVLLLFLWLDLHFFARGRDPSIREGALWSLGWLVVSLLAAVVLLALEGPERAIEYTTVYLIERSLSLDNLFVFLLLFAYFGTPVELRARMLFFGIVFALVLRGLAILGGVALIEEFEFVLYVLGALLILLAYRIWRGVSENIDPDRNLVVRLVRRVFPVTAGYRGNAWFVREEHRTYTTPLFLCLVAVVAADIAFAIDSIPAAFGITRDQFVIWMGNVFALLGLRALFVLVEGLIARFRYLDETIAAVLALVGVKLLVEEWLHIGPVTSLLIVLAAFALGMAASVAADRRELRHSGSGSGSSSSTSSSTSSS